MNTLSRLWRFSLADLYIILGVAFLLPGCALALKLKGYKWMHGAMSADIRKVRYCGSTGSVALGEHYARLVELSARYSFFGFTCLEKALVLCYLLRRKRVLAKLKIGVDKTGGIFRAHAWVELEGRILIGGLNSEECFVAFTGL